MKEILIISGKGGTGKTTVSASLADIATPQHKLVLADVDVDAANLEILLAPHVEHTYPFMAGKVAVIDQDACIACGICEDVCRFDAVQQNEDGKFVIDSAFCEGCLSCVHQCPANAIETKVHQSGEWYRSASNYGVLFHANLYPGEENSGKLVTQVKEDARKFGEKTQADFLLIDGPPGIGCPVTAALNGVDAAVIVSEPTLTGFHDMRRAKETADFFRIPTLLVINKSDLNPAIRDEMLVFSAQKGMALAGLIPYDEEIVHALSARKPLTQTLPERYHPLFSRIWQDITTTVCSAI